MGEHTLTKLFAMILIQLAGEVDFFVSPAPVGNLVRRCRAHGL